MDCNQPVCYWSKYCAIVPILKSTFATVYHPHQISSTISSTKWFGIGRTRKIAMQCRSVQRNGDKRARAPDTATRNTPDSWAVRRRRTSFSISAKRAILWSNFSFFVRPLWLNNKLLFICYILLERKMAAHLLRISLRYLYLLLVSVINLIKFNNMSPPWQ